MTFQNDPIRKITFEDQFPFLLVPDEMLSEVISRCQEGPRLLLALDSFFPPDLISYLEQVLEINRLLPSLRVPHPQLRLRHVSFRQHTVRLLRK